MQIFVGGAGRSGTTIGLRVIGTHPNIYTLPIETRFIADPDGILDLADNLTQRYSLTRSRAAIQRFEHLMRSTLATPKHYPYEHHNLPAVIGESHYHSTLNSLLSDLISAEFEGRDYPAPAKSEPEAVKAARSFSNALNRLRRRSSPTAAPPPTASTIRQARYYPDRDLLDKRLAQFVHDLFIYPANMNGCEHWCEKTPHNLMHLAALSTMFPEAVIIHFYRDPRGIVDSLCRQPWAPDELEPNCAYVEDYYRVWHQQKKLLGKGPKKLIEISLESLSSHPTKAMQPVWDLCNVSAPSIYAEVSASTAQAWRSRMSPQDQSWVSTRLEETIRILGYQP